MKIFALAGSPRKEGNTDLLVEQILKGAEAEAPQLKILDCNQRRSIGYCRHPNT
jgi:multimeric flavodoxin WrbA